MYSPLLTYALITCGIVIFGLGVSVWIQSGTIEDLRSDKARLESNNLTLAGAIEKQNGEIAELGIISAQNFAASQEALRASQAGAADLEATVAELLARPLTINPIDACVVADKTILEFYQ